MAPYTVKDYGTGYGGNKMTDGIRGPGGIWAEKEAIKANQDFGKYSRTTTFWDRAVWEYRRPVFIEKCLQSGKRVWPFEKAYYGVAIWHGPGTPAEETGWLSKEAFTVMRLKGEI